VARVSVTPQEEDEDMSRQLSLIESPPAWRLDERTRETGRRGVAEARAALRSALAEAKGDKPTEQLTSGRRPAA
jgi:hypothetical protein